MKTEPLDKTAATTPRRRVPRPITPTYLENAALHYLERFASSSAHLKRVLMRKVARAAHAHGSDVAEGERMVDALVARYLGAGLIDDNAYAAQRATSLRRRGNSRYAIRSKLALKGVKAELIDETLSRLDAESGEGELAAACALVRRRRLGPYRVAPTRDAYRNKDLATLARAGFGFDVARRVLSAETIETLEAMERGAPPEER
jgi:regulatory protein